MWLEAGGIASENVEPNDEKMYSVTTDQKILGCKSVSSA
jgi:hypothetical protein